MTFPPAVPEIPVAELGSALAYYRDCLGFVVDWGDDGLGLAGLSQGESRVFMSSAAYRATNGHADSGPVVVWLNLSSRAEVDGLHARWSAAGATIDAPPEAKPWKLHEFSARDLDGNVLRVFYDFGSEEREAASKT
uniref:VOC family protein n=1 Tax=Altererythrobacter segetis TaxID=1104773 RepID=UPI001A9C51CE|nr:VOC family protein [Altererythrobacter segetis]